MDIVKVLLRVVKRLKTKGVFAKKKKKKKGLVGLAMTHNISSSARHFGSKREHTKY